MEADGLAWNGPHGSSCNGEQTPEGVLIACAGRAIAVICYVK